MKTLTVLGTFIFFVGASGIILSLMTMERARDAYIDAHGFTTEANYLIIQHGNAVATPILLLSGACLIVSFILIRVVLNDSRGV